MTHLLILGCKDFPPFNNKKIISGGMEVYTYELVKKLSGQIEISLIKGHGTKTNNNCLDGISIYNAMILGKSVLQPVSLTVFSFFKTLKLIKHIDVINAQTPLSALIGAFCKFFLKIPYVVCVHIFGSTKEHAGNNIFARIYFTIEKITLNYADAIVPVGDSLSKFLLDVHKLPQDKLIMIHPGMDFQTVKVNNNLLREKYGIDDGAFVLLYLGRFIKEKGIFDLIDAIKILQEKGIKVNLLFAGSGDLENEIIEESSRKGIKDYISVIGPVQGDIKNQLIKRANLMIRTSYHEVFPITYLEAMSFGTPVIATPVGDVPYLAKTSGAIELVPINNPEKIAESIAKLKASPEQLQKMAECGLKFIETISWENQADKFMKVLEDVVAKRQIV